MTRRRIHTLIWLLLPLFALRAMVPVGYMVNLSGGELSMAVCPMHQTAVQPVDTANKWFGSEESGKSTDKSASDTGSSAIQCPFAAALTAATFLGISVPSLDVVVAATAINGDTHDICLPFGPLRTQQSRAPPAHA